MPVTPVQGKCNCHGQSERRTADLIHSSFRQLLKGPTPSTCHCTLFFGSCKSYFSSCECGNLSYFPPYPHLSSSYYWPCFKTSLLLILTWEPQHIKWLILVMSSFQSEYKATSLKYMPPCKLLLAYWIKTQMLPALIWTEYPFKRTPILIEGFHLFQKRPRSIKPQGKLKSTWSEVIAHC